MLALHCDAHAWWYQALPAPLFAHQSGLQVLSALPRSALARLRKKLAVGHPVPLGQPADQIDSDMGFTSELAEAADLSEGNDASQVVLRLALDLLSCEKSEVDGLTKRRWAQSLADLQDRAQSAGPITTLLLAWCLCLCEHGTVGQSNLARTTVQQYFRRAAVPLFEALKVMTGEPGGVQWAAETMGELHLGLIEVQSMGNKKTMASALNSFHGFLVEWFDIEPLAIELHSEVPPARVQAQVIWPHEIDLVLTWLGQVSDVRVRSAAMIMLRVAAECPARTNELLKLRIANIRIGADERGPCMELEIARCATHGRLKTPAAQRRLTLRNAATIDLIQHWRETRLSEGAPMSAMLFGDPGNDGHVHRSAAVVSVLNRLLKAATGESDVRIHTLRHTAIGKCLEADFASSSVLDPSRYAITATQTGHASAVSTFQSYFHRYEWSLRCQLDAALSELVEVTRSQAARHLGLKPETLRQHVHRSGMKSRQFTWWRLRQVRVVKSFPDVADPFDWRVPVMPDLPGGTSLTLTAAVVLSWLDDLLRGTPVEVLGLRFGVPQESLNGMIQESITICHRLGRVSWPRRFDAQSLRPYDLMQALRMAGLDLARAHQPKFQRLGHFLSQEQATPLLQQACTSWQACRRRGVVALDRDGEALGLYQLLQEATVDPQDLRICAQTSMQHADQLCEREIKANQGRTLARRRAIDDFCAVFGIGPRESAIRADSPAVYLQWDDPSHRKSPSSASSSIAGLDAWMFAIAVLLTMKEVQA
jgi:integrase